MASRRLNTFVCHWCDRRLSTRKLHHAQRGTEPERHCCASCHADPDGSYRKVYPGGETEETESVAAAQRTEIERL